MNPRAAFFIHKNCVCHEDRNGEVEVLKAFLALKWLNERSVFVVDASGARAPA
jgi:hypothetical protein